MHFLEERNMILCIKYSKIFHFRRLIQILYQKLVKNVMVLAIFGWIPNQDTIFWFSGDWTVGLSLYYESIVLLCNLTIKVHNIYSDRWLQSNKSQMTQCVVVFRKGVGQIWFFVKPKTGKSSIKISAQLVFPFLSSKGTNRQMDWPPFT